MLVNKIYYAILKLLSRRFSYRFGRALYLQARGDVANNMDSNGEVYVQKCVITAWKNLDSPEMKLTVFDVGANVGEWSNSLINQLQLKGLKTNIDLYAFEPVPSTAAILRQNLTSDHYSLHIEENALSSTSGKTQIYIEGSAAGSNSLYDDASVPKESIQIELISVSEFVESRQLKHIHLFKIDTEGHDMEVIRGALKILKEENISVLQFEYNHRWAFSRNFLLDVFVIIKELPYKLAKIQCDHLVILDRWHPELEKFFEGNYCLVHEESLSWFKTKIARFDRFNTMVSSP